MRLNDDYTPVWAVSAYPVRTREDGSEETDTAHPLFPYFEVPLSEEREAELEEDHWVTLDQAPEWLRQAVLPSLADQELSAASGLAAWRKGRHDQIMAEGGFASSYDNAFLLDFEEQFPAGTPSDAAAGLYSMRDLDECEGEEAEREAAAAELLDGWGELSRDLRVHQRATAVYDREQEGMVRAPTLLHVRDLVAATKLLEDATDGVLSDGSGNSSCHRPRGDVHRQQVLVGSLDYGKDPIHPGIHVF